jgi:hypothetical protein
MPTVPQPHNPRPFKKKSSPKPQVFFSRLTSYAVRHESNPNKILARKERFAWPNSADLQSLILLICKLDALPIRLTLYGKQNLPCSSAQVI